MVYKMVIVGLLTIAVKLSAFASDSNTDHPSVYGADDRIGAINNISAEKTLAALKLVKYGKIYSLAVVTSAATPTFPGRSYQVDAYPMFEGTRGQNLLSGMDDRITTHLGVGTQIDGLGHVGINQIHYNGVSAKQLLQDGKLVTFGMQDLPPIVTRGVMLNIAALKGVERLSAGTPITRKDIIAAMARQKVNIGKGDVVLLHTGWLSLLDSDPETMMKAEPGLAVDGAQYLVDQGIVAVGADNPALEHIPFANADRPYEVHQLLLTRNGVYILEYINTANLVRDGVNEFLFVVSAPRFDGTVQAVVNPIAIY